MRKLIIALAAILTALGLQAEKVDTAKARHVASVFWEQEVGHVPILADMSRQTGLTELYLFDVDGGKGFVVVAADDIAFPILAYSTQGSFSSNVPAARQMLGGYEEQIAVARNLGVEPDAEIAKEWDDLENGTKSQPTEAKAVSQLITTHWSQNEPYNNMCPIADGQERCVTGCVATAMAQVMRYWKYPAHGVGQHSYSYNDRPIAVTHMLGDPNAEWLYDTLTADFEHTYYAWDNMLDNMSASSPDYAKQAVATLLYHCGVAVDMVYTPSGSGAFMTRAEVLGFDSVNYSTEISAEVVIPQYFGYSPTTVGLMASDYTPAVWQAMLKNELDNGRPIIFAGNEEGSDYGHAFVLDGYDARSRFHCNFGWGGQCDGAFRIGSITPENNLTQYNFSYKQSGILRMYPPGMGTFSVKVKCTGSMDEDCTVMHNGEPVCDSTVKFVIDDSEKKLDVMSSQGYAIKAILTDKDTVFSNGRIIDSSVVSCHVDYVFDNLICDFSDRDLNVTLKIIYDTLPEVIHDTLPGDDSLSITPPYSQHKDTAKVFSRGKTIVVESNALETVSVYDIMGRLNASVDAHGDKIATINVDRSGIYIVRFGNTTRKVLVNARTNR